MEIPHEDALLQRAHKHLQELQVERVESHLSHVNITCGHRFVATLQSIVVIAAIGPFAIRFQNGHQIVAEGIAHNLEPIDIRAGLWNDHALVQLRRIIGMYVLQGPVIAIAKQCIEIGTCYGRIKVVRIDQMSVITLIADVHEDALKRQWEEHKLEIVQYSRD